MGSLVVSSSIVVDAPPAVVFTILADPRQHARVDGSGTVRGALSGPDRLVLGSEFGMDMRMGAPYRIKNRVVEHEEDRLIAWRHLGLHRWRYELEPLGPDGRSTRVTETWDASRYPKVGELALRAVRFPERNRRAIEATLVRLKAAAEDDARVA